MARGRLIAVCAITWLCGLTAGAGAVEPTGGASNLAAYASLQAALDANPGRVLQLPAGDYPIHQRLLIKHDGSGLSGPARIIQRTPAEPILELRGAAQVRVEGLTLTRPASLQDATAAGIEATGCEQLELNRLHVIDNHSQRPSIAISDCTGTQVTDCLVLNYTALGLDDRTASPDYGYAFRCMDGTGIGVRGARDTLLRGNRIIEQRLRPTPAIQATHRLGEFTTRTQRGELVSEELWERQRVDNWHQGAAILVTLPEESRGTRILGNHIENAAQGIDLHCDDVIVSENILKNARSGMKAIHGARHVTIVNNQFIGSDLWAIAVHPGAASHAAQAATGEVPARAQNVDAGTIIAHNIIADFGYGPAYWIWSESGPGDGMGCAIRIALPQKPSNPPLSDVIIEGNLVRDSGRDLELVAGTPQQQAPRYKYALWIAAEEQGGPRNVIVRDNLLDAGQLGRTNFLLAETTMSLTTTTLPSTQVTP